MRTCARDGAAILGVERHRDFATERARVVAERACTGCGVALAVTTHGNRRKCDACRRCPCAGDAARPHAVAACPKRRPVAA